MERARFDEIVGNAETQSLNGIWSQLSFDTKCFERRKELFLWILERLLSDERIKLHRKGTFLQGNVEEHIKMFRHAWPVSEDDADRMCTKPGYEAPYKHFGMDVWWFMDVCPAGVAWRMPDGSYQIAD